MLCQGKSNRKKGAYMAKNSRMTDSWGVMKKAEPPLPNDSPAQQVIKNNTQCIEWEIQTITAVPLHVTMSMELPWPTVS